MNATRLVEAFAGALFGNFHKGVRRTPPREARLRPIVEPVVPEQLESRRLFASVSFASGI